MSDEAFVPGNALEQALVLAIEDRESKSEFYGHFVHARVYVLMDKALGDGKQWDPSINLCVLANESGNPVMAVFTSPERAKAWTERLPDYQHGLLVSSAWLMQGLEPDVGIVVNPGLSMGVELSPKVVQQLKDALATEQAAG